MDDLTAFQTRKPTASRPLLGLTILAVEDSLFACDALRLISLRSGARLRRADCIDSARRHLQVYRPSVIVVDLGLPDGSGTELIADLAQAKPRIEVILGTSGDRFGDEMALAAGADAFLPKPVASVAAFQDAVLSCLPKDRHAPGPRLVLNEHVKADPMAYRDDLAHAASLLETPPDPGTLRYILQFLKGVAKSAEDATLLRALHAVSNAPEPHRNKHPGLAQIAAMVKDRLSDKIAV